MDPEHLDLHTVAAANVPNESEESKYSFTPLAIGKKPRAWERKPATPFHPRFQDHKIWKRYELRSGKDGDDLEVEIGAGRASQRAVKRLRKGKSLSQDGGSSEYIGMRWEEPEERGRRKYARRRSVARTSPPKPSSPTKLFPRDVGNSPPKAFSPSKMPPFDVENSPPRKGTPSRVRSPQKRVIPPRMFSPRTGSSSARNGTPARNTSPSKELVAPGSGSSMKVWSPSKRKTPGKRVASSRTLSPIRALAFSNAVSPLSGLISFRRPSPERDSQRNASEDPEPRVANDQELVPSKSISQTVKVLFSPSSDSGRYQGFSPITHNLGFDAGTGPGAMEPEYQGGAASTIKPQEHFTDERLYPDLSQISPVTVIDTVTPEECGQLQSRIPSPDSTDSEENLDGTINSPTTDAISLLSTEEPTMDVGEDSSLNTTYPSLPTPDSLVPIMEHGQPEPLHDSSLRDVGTEVVDDFQPAFVPKYTEHLAIDPEPSTTSPNESETIESPLEMVEHEQESSVSAVEQPLDCVETDIATGEVVAELQDSPLEAIQGNSGIERPDEENTTWPTETDTNEVIESADATSAATLSFPEPKSFTTDLHDDDTALLKNFLSRAKAKKAAEAASNAVQEALPPRKSSRIALGEVDQNSSSPQKQSLQSEKPSMETNPEMLPGEEASESADLPTTRSGRARILKQKKIVKETPSSIPVRRTDGPEHVILQKSEAQDLALTTRANTKRNKGEAKPPKLKMKDLTSVSTEEIQVIKRQGLKEVSWNDTPVYFGEEAVQEAVKEAKEAREEPQPTTRRLRAPSAGNGTPAPKKKMVMEPLPSPKKAAKEVVGTPAPKRRGRSKAPA